MKLKDLFEDDLDMMLSKHPDEGAYSFENLATKLEDLYKVKGKFKKTRFENFFEFDIGDYHITIEDGRNPRQPQVTVFVKTGDRVWGGKILQFEDENILPSSLVVRIQKEIAEKMKLPRP